MPVSTADLHKAIYTAWDQSGLDAVFKQYWSATDKDDYIVLDDQEAAGQQPWPYCVLDQTNQTVVTRTSSNKDNQRQKREIRDVEVRFNVFAQDEPTGDPKQLAANLAEEVMKVFGGHPNKNPTAVIQLEHGNHLLTRYQDDFGIKSGEDEWQWVVVYLIRIDVPVAV